MERYTYNFTRCRICHLQHEEFEHPHQFVLCPLCKEWHLTECKARADRIAEYLKRRHE